MKCWLPKAEDKQLDVVLQYPSHLPRHFIGDAGRIRQVVTNLVGNAVKFTAHVQILIEVESEIGDAVSARMRVSVNDTGCGIRGEDRGALSKIQPGRQFDHQEIWRHRIGAGDIQTARGTDGRLNRSPQQPGEAHFLVYSTTGTRHAPSIRARSRRRPARVASDDRGRQRGEPARTSRTDHQLGNAEREL